MKDSHQLHPVIAGGICHHEIGNLIIYNGLVMIPTAILMLLYWGSSDERRIYAAEGIHQTLETVPLYPVGDESQDDRGGSMTTKTHEEEEPLVVVDEGEELLPEAMPAAPSTANGREPVLWAELDPKVAVLRSTPNPNPTSLNSQEIAAAQERIAGGKRFTEQTLSGFDGLDHVDKLRSRRSLYLLILLGNCLLLLVMVGLTYLKFAHAPVKLIPSYAVTSTEVGTTIDRGDLRSFAERVITRKYTWSGFSADYVRKNTVLFFAPEIAGAIDKAMAEEMARDQHKRQVCFITGSVPRKAINDTVYPVLVAYEVAEGLENNDGKSMERMRLAKMMAELEVVRVYRTEDNPIGLQIIRYREYSEQQWLSNGGDDVWSILRHLGEKKK